MPDDQPPLSSEPHVEPPLKQAEIVLQPTTVPARVPVPKPQTPGKPKAGGETNSVREVVETIVFVVILVLLLKTFLAEAFVIPTGSMATTLLGYHREVVCQKCGYHFKVNASSEADPQERHPQPVVSCTCPNCEFANQIFNPFVGGGR